MLSQVYISNYALIKELNLKLDHGFTTITGETGAGKSILLGALGLVLGSRADSKVLADDHKKCIVEATFNIADLDLRRFFAENDIDFEPNTILRREILPTGKSRAFINDTPVKLDLIKSLGDRLIDVHSQHDSILMMNPSYQLELLDTLAENSTSKQEYDKTFVAYQQLLGEQAELEASISVDRDTDYIQFLVDELEKSAIKEGEEEAIEDELNRLRHAEDIQRSLATGVYQLNDDMGVLDRLNDAAKALEEVSNYLPKASELADRIRSAEIELRDVVSEMENEVEGVVLDEARLINLDQRFSHLQHLMQKHQVSNTHDLVEKFEDLVKQLDLAKSGTQALEAKKLEVARHYVLLKEKAKVLHASRVTRAQTLESELSSYLKQLQLPNAHLCIQVDMTDRATTSGFDQVQFLFTANHGSKPIIIHKVASGGELSRVMLALKAILANTKRLPAIIFDEIDTGISGETARRAAQILKQMGEKMQVIAITHLPQIAASGAKQLQVFKTVEDSGTRTHIEKLDQSDRVEEIARLLSGTQVSEAARKTAEELLN